MKVTKVDSVKGSTFVVMDKNSAQAKLYVHYPGFILPDGMLDFFRTGLDGDDVSHGQGGEEGSCVHRYTAHTSY